MSPDGLEILREHAPTEHDLEMIREAKKEFYFDDDDLAEDQQRERDRQDIISLGRYG